MTAELQKAGIRADKRTEKQLDVDAEELQTQLAQAATEMDTH
ncbi:MULTISPECIES: hypothetical protein [unclassified Cryobacterium]|nr:MULTISPECIES: hypothetical protein [unclassified Cryobacterium]